ncbi:hypothetical protein BMIN_1654, partial [Bifidobacterium minimum]
MSLISVTMSSSSVWVRFFRRGVFGQVAADHAVAVPVAGALPGRVWVGVVG